jgi:hypothetical protein
MAEQQPAAESGKRSGWFKAIIGGLLGLMSGAVMTYVTPIVDRFVKPAKPLANFDQEQQGLTVTFHNRSTGGAEGWWDFGDGSPLQPFSSRDGATSHSYAKPGTYTAKLSLRNFVGEESDRSVSVNLEAPKPTEPAIATFEAVPLSQGAYAPATFRISSKVQNADLCIYDFGERHCLNVVTDPANETDRIITFHRAGPHTIRVVAVSGKKTVERCLVVQVNQPPAGMACALLTVTYQGTLVEKAPTIPEHVFVTIPQDHKEKVYSFDREFRARVGFTITDVRLNPANPEDAKIMHLEKSPDGQSVHVKGQLQKPSGWGLRKGKMPSVLAQLIMTQEKRTPQTVVMEPKTEHFTMPGAVDVVMPDPPRDWVNVQAASMKLTLMQDNQVLWEENQLPRGAAVLIKNRPCKLTATVVDKKVKVELSEVKPSLRAASN